VWWWLAGLLPYFFTILTDPSYSLEVNRCIYNNMFDNPECRNTSEPLVKNVHFTVCQKPWTCHRHDRNVRCNLFLDKWYQLRREVRAGRGMLSFCVDAFPLEGLKQKRFSRMPGRPGNQVPSHV
jgi:hypothetical protein